MSGFDIGSSISKSWALYKNNFWLVVGASVVAVVLGLVTGGVLAGPMLAGLMLLFFKLMDQKGDARFEDIFKGFSWFLPAFLIVLIWGTAFWVAALILAVIPLLGWMALVLLGFAFSVFLFFALCDAVAHESSFDEASRTAYAMLKNDFWPLVGYGVMVILIGVSGRLLFDVGIVLTIPFAFLMLAVAYRECQQPPEVIEVEPEIAPAV